MLRRHPDKLLVTGEDRFLGYSLMLGARAALIGMGAALPDLQAELLRAWAARDWPALRALSELCDRFAAGDLHRSDGGVHPPDALGGRRGRRVAAGGLRRSLGSPAARRQSGPPSSAWCGCARDSTRDFERFARAARATPPRTCGRPTGIDLDARYLGFTLPHPIGKGSGQLSLNVEQLETDRAAGLAFVGAQDRDRRGRRGRAGPWGPGRSTRPGCRSSAAASGRPGGLDGHLEGAGLGSFVRGLSRPGARGGATSPGRARSWPSPRSSTTCPRSDEPFRDRRIPPHHRALARRGARDRCRWRRTSPPPWPATRWPTSESGSSAGCARCRRRSGPRPDRRAVRLALKLMNARFDDAFQLEMLDAAGCGRRAGRASTGCGIRRAGVAYGGCDLSERNLRVLAARPRGGGSAAADRHRQRLLRPPDPGVCPAGCESVQLHTFFQLPLSEYPATAASAPQRALHALLFHPRTA